MSTLIIKSFARNPLDCIPLPNAATSKYPLLAVSTLSTRSRTLGLLLVL